MSEEDGEVLEADPEMIVVGDGAGVVDATALLPTATVTKTMVVSWRRILTTEEVQ